jgi:DNA polymerase
MSTIADRPPAPVPSRPTPAKMREAVQGCRACDLWEGATQAVMGEGARRASLMLVGEQPGDREDIQGHPFVGPAGAVLDRALQRAGIATDDVYITNVVKHFRYKARGKRRIHQKPDRWQVTACLPWLEAEIEMVNPAALVWERPRHRRCSARTCASAAIADGRSTRTWPSW